MTPETLTLAEVAAILRVSKSTIRRRALDGTLPALRLGSQLRFSRETLERMLAGGNVAHTGDGSCTTVSIKGTTHPTGGQAGQKQGERSGKAQASEYQTIHAGPLQKDAAPVFSVEIINRLLSGTDG